MTGGYSKNFVHGDQGVYEFLMTGGFSADPPCTPLMETITNVKVESLGTQLLVFSAPGLCSGVRALFQNIDIPLSLPVKRCESTTCAPNKQLL